MYVGSQTGDLHAVNLADGKLKWKYKASPDGIGESSPAVAAGLVYIGDLSGTVHAVDVDKLPWVKTRFPGVEAKTLMENKETGLATLLMRWAPGARD